MACHRFLRADANEIDDFISVPRSRRFVGWEMNPEYTDVARRRLVVAREQLEIGL